MCYDDLRARMCKELHDIEERGTFCRCDLDDTHKLIESICGLDAMSAPAEEHHKADKHETAHVEHAAHPAHLTLEDAKRWTSKMQNADGTKGCHWTLEQTQDVAKQRNITCDPNDFWAVMNMMYSDYCQVAKRQSVDTPGFYADMAKAFLEDADAADGKAYLYWDCIADK
ncbi:DUF7841 family protein [Segatella hominis]|uniref:DUF7841 family protein n=1 Tax=Segatella hominis TaxID=2518605 RepID=UPI003F81EF53